jgi:hypothetical protein
LALLVAAAIAAVLVSGSDSADPRAPAGLPGKPPPLLGVALVGSGGMTVAIDAYGAVVDLRPNPASPALLAVSAASQAAGSADPAAAIVPMVRLRAADEAVPIYSADWVRQRYRGGTNVLVTKAGFGRAEVAITWVATDDSLACLTAGRGGSVALSLPAQLHGEDVLAPEGTTKPVHCDDPLASRAFRQAIAADRRWLARARPLGAGAPAWASRLYGRSLLVLRGLTAPGGAVAAGPREGWAYVWPRDAGAAALAYASAGYLPEARRVARFLLGLDLEAAARFDGDGDAVEGRDAQGDAGGWTAAAADAAGLRLPPSLAAALRHYRWRDRPDYQEKSPGNYLANALAAQGPGGPKTLLDGAKSARRPRLGWSIVGDPGSGVDSAVAWAVRPFARPALYPAARRSLRLLLSSGGRFGIVPSADWPEDDPWSAPTAWSAWAFATLTREDSRRHTPALARADRRDALRLLATLRRAATPAGDLPERVDARSGLPRSTTPLAWSHAFAILALRELWPSRR